MSDRVATVAGHAVLASRVDQRVAEMRGGPRRRHVPPAAVDDRTHLRRWIARELVREAVLLHEARALGFLPPDFAGPLSPAQLARLVAHVTAGVTIAAADARAYYRRNPDLYRRRERRRLRHVLLADEGDARRVAARAAAGEDFGDLARARSIDAGSRARGGDLGEVHRGALAGPLEDAVFEAPVGAVVGPIRTEHGWHVVRVDAVASEAVLDFAVVRPAIEAELLAAARRDAFEAWLEDRVRALAVVEPGYEHVDRPAQSISAHRH